MLGLVDDNDGLAERRGIAGVERRVPLLVFLAEAHDHDVCLLDQCTGADGVELRTLVVVPELVGLGPEDRDTAIVGCLVMRDRRGEPHVEVGGGRALFDALAPVGVDFAGEIDTPGHGRLLGCSRIKCDRRAASRQFYAARVSH